MAVKGAAKRRAKGKSKARAQKSGSNGGSTKPRADVKAQVERAAKLSKQDKPLAEIAETLGVTPGRAAYLLMLDEVSRKPKLRIKYSDDEDLGEKVKEAREAEDEHSSWGWISARAGVSEAKVKRLAEEAGVKVSGTNVAQKRAGSNGGGTTKGKGRTRKGKGRRRPQASRS